VKDFIPNEEDFETLLASLSSHEKALATEALVKEALSRVDLDDVGAFEKAFSQPPEGMAPMDAKKVVREILAMQDRLTLLKAKVIEFRNFVRAHSDKVMIDELLK
jgi:hypothetical protein